MTKYEILAERLVDQIIESGLCHAHCVEDDKHGCVVVWSSSMVEQLGATLQGFCEGVDTMEGNEMEKETGSDDKHDSFKSV